MKVLNMHRYVSYLYVVINPPAYTRKPTPRHGKQEPTLRIRRKSCVRVLDGIVVCGISDGKAVCEFWMESWCVEFRRQSCVRVLDGIAVCGVWTEKLCASLGWNRGVWNSDGKTVCDFLAGIVVCGIWMEKLCVNSGKLFDGSGFG